MSDVEMSHGFIYLDDEAIGEGGDDAAATLNAWRDAEVRAAVAAARAEWESARPEPPPENRAADDPPDAAHVHVATGVLRSLALYPEGDCPGGLLVSAPRATLDVIVQWLGRRVRTIETSDARDPRCCTWHIEAED